MDMRMKENKLEAENTQIRMHKDAAELRAQGLELQLKSLTEMHDALIKEYNDLLERKNTVNNPCGHSGFESASCDICGYPDSRKLIQRQKEEIDSLGKELDGLADCYKEGIISLKKDNKKLKEENKRLRELVDGARVIVEVFQWSSPAQERWREDWLAKAEQAMKDTRDEG